MTRLEPGTVLDGIDRDGAARLIVGTPGSGKTEFALSVLMAGLRRYGGTYPAVWPPTHWAIG